MLRQFSMVLEWHVFCRLCCKHWTVFADDANLYDETRHPQKGEGRVNFGKYGRTLKYLLVVYC